MPGTVGVAAPNRKTAALFFERVWNPPFGDPDMPSEIIFFGGSETERWYQAVGAAYGLGKLACNDQEFAEFAAILEEALLQKTGGGLDKSLSHLSNGLNRELNVLAVPMYQSVAARDAEYKIGQDYSLVAAIENLELVQEEKLSWDQVVEFRHDHEASAKLRRMRHWLDREYNGQSLSAVSDAIALRLEEYEWALKKHGIKTLTGTLSELLDPKLITAAAATVAGLGLAGAGLWAAIGGGAIMVGRAAVSVTEKFIDLADRKRGQGSEVAFVHELKKLAPKK